MTGRVAIVGGGPAGLIAAERLAAAGLRVTVYDRMPSLARKFLMAGRGGLNLTHSEPLPAFLARYGPARSRLEPAVSAFPPDTLRAWCEGLGEPVFVGSSGRVFPRAMKASPLLRAWLRHLEAAGVAIATRHAWQGWDADGALLFETPDGPARVHADATLLALGGASWPRLGADGVWADVLQRAGLAVAPLRPANAGIVLDWSEPFRARFEGRALKRIALTHAGTTVRGEAIVTAGGLEGGAVYALSAAIRNAIAAEGSAALALDLRPDLTAAALAARLARPRGRQSLSTFLRKTAGLAPAAIGLLREAGGHPLPALPAGLAALIKSLPLRTAAMRPLERAISTAGGLAFENLDAAFMVAARPGLFAAGEMLDWEAPTGGYLLQGCFSTGVAAANGMISWLAARDQKPRKA